MSVTIKYSILFFYFLIFHSTFVSAIEPVSTNVSVDIENNFTEDDNIIETQYAVCKISTEELVANAGVTVTKVLTGACNAKNIETRFKKLEKHLSEELQEIKVLLRTLMEERDTFLKINDHRIRRNNELNVKLDNRSSPNNHKLFPRQYEINEFNNTIITNESSSIFTYYWEVRDFNEKLSKWDRTQFERSSTFYIGQLGYAMYLKIVPKYFPDGTVFISVSLTRGLYDSFVKWPFFYKIQLSILDQSLGERQEDRQSRIWDPSALCTEYFWKRPMPIGEPDNPECVGLSIPRNIILSKLPLPFPTATSQFRYIRNDSILIKLVIYL